jgi:glycerate dehydrogenase
VDFETLPKTADFVTLHAPLTASTKQIINQSNLKLMKKSAYLINTARGPLVDEKAVRAALENGQIAGYACDVVSEAPMKTDNPLLGAPNCLITPHIAWAATETRQRLLNIVVENIKGFFEGHPQNVVS